MNRAQRIFRGMKILKWMHVTILLSKPKECTPPEVNPKVSLGLWMIIMC